MTLGLDASVNVCHRFFFLFTTTSVCVNTRFLCECTCASLCVGGWQAPSRCLGNCPWLCDGGYVSAAAVRGRVTPRQVLCTSVCASPNGWIAGPLGRVLCGCALTFPVSCVVC